MSSDLQRRLGYLVQLIDSMNEAVGRAVSWLTLIMVVVTFAVVVLRYLFSTGWIAMQESVTYMHALVFMLAAAYTLKHDEHVRVDVIYRTSSKRYQTWVNLLGSLFLLLPVCFFILGISWHYVTASWSVMEASQEAGGIPAVFLLKSVILVAALLLLLQGISITLKHFITLFHKSPHENKADNNEAGP